MKKQVLIACGIILSLSACQKDFTAEVPGADTMVVNSQFNTNGPMTLYLTTSYPASNANNNVAAITDAQIALYENNVFKENLRYVPSNSLNTFGFYTSALTPQAGNTYMIKATEKNYSATVSATDVIPGATQILSCDLLQYPATGSGQMEVDLKFQDPASNTIQYYRLDMYLVRIKLVIDQYSDTVYESSTTNISPTLLSAVSDTVRDPSGFLLFSDRGWNGQQKELLIEHLTSALSSNVVSANLLVELHAVSTAHYNYYQTLSVYNSTNVNTGIQSYVYSNVTNGYGIFCGETWQENTLKLR
jgi:hypothetical protein